MPETDKGKGDGKTKLSNPQIYRRNKDSGKLEVKDGVNDDDIKLLEEEGLLENDFNLDLGYFSPAFMEKRLEILREKYKDLTGELPRVYANCDGGMALKVNEGPCLTILRGEGKHTKLFVTRPGVDGKTEIYIMDSNSNDYDKDIEAAYNDTNKYTIVYPDTEVSRQDREKYDKKEEKIEQLQLDPSKNQKEIEKEIKSMFLETGDPQRNSLGIQKDVYHCASYAVHFADRLYRKIREVKNSDSKKNIIDCFNEVMADIGKDIYEAKVEFRKKNLMVNRKMFSMPKEFWIYSGSEGALDRMITVEKTKQLEEENKKRMEAGDAAMTDKEIKDKVKEIETNMKRKLAPYKAKREDEEKIRMKAGEEKRAEELEFLERLGKARSTIADDAYVAYSLLEEELAKKKEEMGDSGPGEKTNEIEALELRTKAAEDITNQEYGRFEEIQNRKANLANTELVSGKIKIEVRAEYAITHNWRMKELKLVADELRKAKEVQEITGQVLAEIVEKAIELANSKSQTDLEEDSTMAALKGGVKGPKPFDSVINANVPTTPAVPDGPPSFPRGGFTP
ncbi:MAG: hypothetical protein LBU15_02770 [Rickettsiales bacterium]|jgi:hypothetical protein|nr:hypothetical protein [Rickettsiales bacterium]